MGKHQKTHILLETIEFVQFTRHEDQLMIPKRIRSTEDDKGVSPNGQCWFNLEQGLWRKHLTADSVWQPPHALMRE